MAFVLNLGGDTAGTLCRALSIDMKVHTSETILSHSHIEARSGDNHLVKYEGFDFPDNLYYTTDQIWLKKEEGTVRIGFTTFGMDLAGKIKFVRLRPAGAKIEAGKSIGTLESGKWTGPVKSPVSGTLKTINDELKTNPGLLNQDPYGKGWVATIEATNLAAELKALQGASGLDAWIKKEFAEKKKK
jgi:glycine cleavage system H protein